MASMKSLLTLLSFLVLLVLSFSEAREFQVDGKKNSWKIPSSPDEFNKWAEKLRFEVGDSIELQYDAKADSVLEVSEADYNNCNKANPIKSFNDGNTKIVLDRPGFFYFISGADGHCEKGQKLVVEVLSCKHGSNCHYSPAPASNPASTPALTPASAPSMLPDDAPAPAPTSAGHGLSAMSSLVLVMGALVGLLLA